MRDEETVRPEGDEALPGGSAPGGAQPDPAEQEGGAGATPGEAQSENPKLDPEMIDEDENTPQPEGDFGRESGELS